MRLVTVSGKGIEEHTDKETVVYQYGRYMIQIYPKAATVADKVLGIYDDEYELIVYVNKRIVETAEETGNTEWAALYRTYSDVNILRQLLNNWEP